MGLIRKYCWLNSKQSNVNLCSLIIITNCSKAYTASLIWISNFNSMLSTSCSSYSCKSNTIIRIPLLLMGQLLSSSSINTFSRRYSITRQLLPQIKNLNLFSYFFQFFSLRYSCQQNNFTNVKLKRS